METKLPKYTDKEFRAILGIKYSRRLVKRMKATDFVARGFKIGWTRVPLHLNRYFNQDGQPKQT